MKKMYLDIMERSLAAYTDARIRDYIDEVKRDGLTEHGFPRLAANMGILIAHGRRTELLDTFIEIMDICCREMPCRLADNDFSIREVCHCLMLMEQKQTVSKELLEKWKSLLSAFDPWKFYGEVDDRSGRMIGNFAMFAAASEYVRGIYCGIDTSAFVDWQLPSQLARLDCNGMYQEDPPFCNHMVYDLAVRALMAFLLRAGYKGKYADRIEKLLDSTAELTLKMQSTTGEFPFGGRSNQFLHNEAWLCSYCEMEAARFAEKGDLVKAGEFKAAALLAAEATLRYLNLDPISHIKNRYDVSTLIGCEDYAYFNKYMITTASNVYMAFLFTDDRIAPSVAPAEKGGYVISASEVFHKTFLSAGGYYAQIDTYADGRYDANGLGRVHKKGCPSSLCLSAPFAKAAAYVLEGKNPMRMSLCCYTELDGRKLISADRYVHHYLVKSESSQDRAEAVFDVNLAVDVTVRQKYTVSQSGVDIALSGREQLGFMVPVFDFDGQEQTAITLTESEIAVTYQGAVCRYRFDGNLDPNFRYFYNRNGRYRVFAIAASALHIEMENVNEK